MSLFNLFNMWKAKPRIQNPKPPTLEDMILFAKETHEILSDLKDAQIVLDKDNAFMFKAIEESLGELKLSE